MCFLFQGTIFREAYVNFLEVYTLKWLFKVFSLKSWQIYLPLLLEPLASLVLRFLIFFGEFLATLVSDTRVEQLQYSRDSRWFLAGGFKYFFIFTPIWGRFQNLTNIFPKGWNHHLVILLEGEILGGSSTMTCFCGSSPWGMLKKVGNKVILWFSNFALGWGY